MSAFAKFPGNTVLRSPGQMLALEPRYLFDAAAVTTAVDATAEPASNESTTTSTQDTNEESAVALVAAVAAVDAAGEKDASNKVKTEVKKQPETPPGAQTDHENKQGKVETVEDYGASVNNLRRLQGMGPIKEGGVS